MARFTRQRACAGAVTLIQRFGSAINLNIHFHMLFLDGVYVERCDGALPFRWVKAPTSAELSRLAHTIARSVGRFLEREGLLARDAENSYLAGEAEEEGSMGQLLGSSITYRIGVGPQQGRKVFTLPVSERWARWPGFLCMPGWRPERMNARSGSGCAAT